MTHFFAMYIYFLQFCVCIVSQTSVCRVYICSFYRLSQVVLQVTKQQAFPPHVRSLVLEMCCNDTDGEDVEVPYIKYDLPKKA